MMIERELALQHMHRGIAVLHDQGEVLTLSLDYRLDDEAPTIEYKYIADSRDVSWEDMEELFLYTLRRRGVVFPRGQTSER